MQLRAQKAALSVDDPGQFLIECPALFVYKEGPKPCLLTGTSPMMIMAQPPAEMVRIRSNHCSLGSPMEVGAKIMRFFKVSPP